MSCDQVLDKLSEKLNSRLLVQEEHGFQKGAQFAPWPQEQKKAGLDRVNQKLQSTSQSNVFVIRLKANAEDSLSHIMIHAASRN